MESYYKIVLHGQLSEEKNKGGGALISTIIGDDFISEDDAIYYIKTNEHFKKNKSIDGADLYFTIEKMYKLSR